MPLTANMHLIEQPRELECKKPMLRWLHTCIRGFQGLATSPLAIVVRNNPGKEELHIWLTPSQHGQQFQCRHHPLQYNTAFRDRQPSSQTIEHTSSSLPYHRSTLETTTSTYTSPSCHTGWHRMQATSLLYTEKSASKRLGRDSGSTSKRSS
jgi:hypothetical protein